MRGVLRRWHRSRGPARLQLADHLTQPCLLGDRDTVAALRLLGHALQSPFGLLQVGKHQLCLDRLDVRHWIYAAFRMHDALVRVRPDDMYDRVGLTDVGEEAIATALSFVG